MDRDPFRGRGDLLGAGELTPQADPGARSAPARRCGCKASETAKQRVRGRFCLIAWRYHVRVEWSAGGIRGRSKENPMLHLGRLRDGGLVVLGLLVATSAASAVELRDPEVAAGGGRDLSNSTGTVRIENARVGRSGRTFVVPEPALATAVGSGVALLVLLRSARQSRPSRRRDDALPEIGTRGWDPTRFRFPTNFDSSRFVTPEIAHSRDEELDA